MPEPSAEPLTTQEDLNLSSVASSIDTFYRGNEKKKTDTPNKRLKNSRKRLTKREERQLQEKAVLLYSKGHSLRLLCHELSIREDLAKRLLWEPVSQQSNHMPRTKFLFKDSDTLAKALGITGEFTAEFLQDGVVRLERIRKNEVN